MTTAPRIEHLIDRPDWNCRVCGLPWPCPRARADLLVEFRAFPSVLTIYLSAQMYDALSDWLANGRPTPPDIYERFVSWARRPASCAR